MRRNILALTIAATTLGLGFSVHAQEAKVGNSSQEALNDYSG